MHRAIEISLAFLRGFDVAEPFSFHLFLADDELVYRLVDSMLLFYWDDVKDRVNSYSEISITSSTFRTVSVGLGPWYNGERGCRIIAASRASALSCAIFSLTMRLTLSLEGSMRGSRVP